MQEKLFKNEQNSHKAGDGKKEQLLILIGIIFVLILPLILVFAFEPAYWFLSFTSIVTGVTLSEIIVYYVSKCSMK
jgi:hypothetical protein